MILRPRAAEEALRLSYQLIVHLLHPRILCLVFELTQQSILP